VLNFYFLFSWWSYIRQSLYRTVASNIDIVRFQVSDELIWNTAGLRENYIRYRSVTIPSANFQKLTQDLHCEKAKTNSLSYGRAKVIVRVNCYEHKGNS
jgi:hypothetical protein